MSFFSKAKRPVSRKAKREKMSAEILSRLNDYIDSEINEPIEFLVSFWKDQQNAITYKEIRQILLDGTLTESALNLWQQDYSNLVSTKLSPLWGKSIQTGASKNLLLESLDGFSFNMQKRSVTSWINRRGAEFATGMTKQQREAIKVFLNESAKGVLTVDELSRVIRPCIGLNKSQAEANLKLYQRVKATLEKNHPKMSKKAIEQKAREASIKYAERQVRQRAFDIAQSEMAFAYNQGADEGIRQAQAENLLGEVRKVWSSSGNENVCDICAGLDGVPIGMDEEFDFKGKVLFAGQKRLPPAHPRCACVVMYEEVSPPVFGKKRGETMAKQFSEYIKHPALVNLPVIKNGTDHMQDGESENEEKALLKGQVRIEKSEDDKMLAFGWANVAISKSGEQIEDYQEDIVDPEELENAAYHFVKFYREGGEMHERGDCATLVESIVFTKEKMEAMGIPEGTVPEGWWIGFQVTDPDVWDKVKDGTYPMFSIEGVGERVEV